MNLNLTENDEKEIKDACIPLGAVLIISGIALIMGVGNVMVGMFLIGYSMAMVILSLREPVQEQAFNPAA